MGSARRAAIYLARPGRRTFSSRWSADIDGVHLRSLLKSEGKARERRSISWEGALARASLAEVESVEWRAMDASSDRRTEWLYGRIAAKDAVRVWAARTHSLALAPRDIEIVRTDAGAPLVRCEQLAGLGQLPALSITHSRTFVVAAVGDSRLRVGVDIEDRGRNVDRLARALSESENELVATGGLSVLEVLVAKEAAAKAVGVGLGGSLARWPVVGLDAGAFGGPSVQVGVPADIESPAGLPSHIVVRLRTERNSVLALAIVI